MPHSLIAYLAPTQSGYAATAGARLSRLACVLAVLCALEGCISSVRSFVAVEPLDLHEGYREYSDSLLSSGRLSLATRQALNLVPEAAAAESTAKQLAALKTSERIDPATRAFARCELALRAAQTWDGKEQVLARQYYLVAAREAARLLFPDGKMIHIDPFDQKYRLASAFYSLAAGRYFLLLMASGRNWTGDITEVTPDGEFNVTFDNDDSDLYAYFFSDFTLAWGYRITGLRNRYTRDGIGIPLVARRAPGKGFPLEQFFPAGGYIAPITVYLRFDPDDGNIPPDAAHRPAERVRVGLADTRLAEYVCFGRQTLPVAADFTAPYAVQVTRDHSRAAARAALFGTSVPGSRLGLTISAPWDEAKIPLILVHGLAASAETWRELTNDILGSEELRRRYQIIHYTYATNETFLAAAARFRRELAEFLAVVKYDSSVSPKLVLIGHSMGGLLAKSLAVESGNALWDAAFRVPAGSLHASDAARRTFTDALILKPWTSVGLIIFMGTPQHGSDEADGLLGRLSASLLSLPADYVNLSREIGLRDPQELQPDVRSRFTSGRMTSVASLSPRNPLMQAYGGLAIAAGVPFYSIMGTATHDAHGRTSDGYVTVESARLPGSVSDTLLPIRHQQFDRAAPLNVVYRILREHAKTVPDMGQALAQGCPN
ncbi:MAG TPA: alpha/beta fold hydrolase [Steroidobacteraceae bacterium]|nr:alpha/beta fold hydrolase [Steroidobacteraceae bacterium]